MSTPDSREAKLPRWVQDELRQLRMRLAEARKAIDARTNSVPNSDTIIDPYGEYPHGLGRGEAIEFRLGDDPDAFIRARVLRDSSGKATLDLNAGTGISILPRASNAIEIEIRGR